MCQAWRELMFADPDQAAKADWNPVVPAKRSQATLEKLKSRMLNDGTLMQSFPTQMAELAPTIVRNTFRTPGNEPDRPSFEIVTTANTKQRRALELIAQVRVQTETGTKNYGKSLSYKKNLL